MHSNKYTLLFAVIVTVVASLLLASAATLLKPYQERNEELDLKTNILKSLGLVPEEGLSPEKIEQVYADSLEEIFVTQDGKVSDSGELPVYLRKNKAGDLVALAVPVSGKGLWSTIYGYLSLEPDFETVRWVTFYKHGETPGLGGEIEKEWFSENFAGKKIFSPDGELVSIRIARGNAESSVPQNQLYHTVDGISGATLTGKGVTQFLREDLQKYEAWFKNRKKEVD